MNTLTVSILVPACLTGAAMAQGWLTFNDETSTRLSAASELGAADDREKDYAWGDVDKDGDVDLICVRKEPFTSAGRNANVLLMNESGVLVDRTTEYASTSDVAGDQGFLTPTNDRDVILVDLDGDTWLDMVTCPTLTDNDQKHLSHPRVYMNLGESGGLWLGFGYEDARIPTMHPTAGPRFCSVAAGDIDADGDEDLYFGDYDSGPEQISDYNNRLLINDGNGFFTDESSSRMNEEMLLSAFGAASAIADMNNDGTLDVVKQTSLNPPQHVAITYNGTSPEGDFVDYEEIDENQPYFISVDDLNGDGRMDIVVVDDGSDRYYLNEGNGSDGLADFSSYTLENSNGFGGNSLIVDLNDDGLNDIIVTDVDVDIAGCTRTTHIYRNLGDTPNVTFSEQYVGIDLLQGVHDIAVFDINGDGVLDMVFGRCDSTEIYIQEGPSGILFGYPSGLPGLLEPGVASTLEIQLNPIDGVQVDASSVRVLAGVGSDPLAEVSLVDMGGNLYTAQLPAVDCPELLSFRIEASSLAGEAFVDPPSDVYTAVAASGSEITFQDSIEDVVDDWSVTSDSSLTSGAWEAVDPLGTIFGTDFAQPDIDATNGAQNVKAFITQNGTEGGSVGEADVDGGPTWLVTPVMDLDGTDGTVSYARWFFDSEGQDVLTISVSSNDGADWTFVDETSGTGSAWEIASFQIGEYVVPSSEVRIRFEIADANSPSVVEGGIDNLELNAFVCPPAGCDGDVDGDLEVNVADLLAVIAAWGQSGSSADLNQDGVVDVADLLAVIAGWGGCDEA
ncbi:MAG: hypothetical protein CMJ24_01075 [Phycisphaerae bacterium]|nr:hypothetical protein [Phycisphaerae bacterium]|tara:strand:+ start:4683 stop:7046 length:2364 start_codon:yes stop_codon:yes gene_type:complete